MPSDLTIDLAQFKIVEPVNTQEKPVREELSQSRLRSLLHYDPSTGVFTRRVSTNNRVKPGDIAGSKDMAGYSKIMVNNKLYKAHRLAWFYVHGAWPCRELDHINGDRSDNRLCNLREATSAENKQNIKARADNKVGYLGVSPYRSKYQARIRVDGTQIYLGNFDTPEQAHQAYLAAKAKLHKFQPTPRAE